MASKITRSLPRRSNGASKSLERNEPKYRSIREAIRESIVNGLYPRGDRLPTEDELGAHFGASRNTVIRALVDLRNDGLLQRVQGAGTFVTELSPPSRQSFAFVAGGDFDLWTKSTVFGRLEMALGRKLHERNAGYALLPDLRLSAGDNNEQHRADAIESALAKGVTGIFLLPGRSQGTISIDEEFIGQSCRGIGVVLLDRDLTARPRRSGFDLVSLDNFSGGVRLGEHLLAQGCRKVVFLVWAHQAEPVKQRLAGLKSVVEEAGAQVRVADGRDANAIHAALKGSNYDAVVGKDDHMAAAAMRVLYELGRRVPDEVKLAGFDDSPLAAELAVPLTTYAQPVDAIADAATHLMLTRIENPSQPAREVIVSGKLVVRRSTATD